MKPKILFVANIHKHFRAFHIPYIQYLQQQGYEVHVAANDGETAVEEADKQYNIPINRNPFSNSNLKSIAFLKKIIKDENYSLVHCHTAMGSVVARLASKSFRKKNQLKLLYTAHGFHFYKGSPKLYWQLYYPMEKFLSRYTDAIITINKEDFDLIQQRKFKNLFTFLIPGVGVKQKKFMPVEAEVKKALRKKNNLSEDDFILVYAAEYIYRKNHQFLIHTVTLLKQKIPNLKILLAGRGRLMQEIKKEIEVLNLSDTVLQLGFRTDIDEVYKLVDIGVSTSRQEGLGLNLVEEMMCGLPVVATIDRGHKEVIDHALNGFLFEQENKEEFIEAILKLYTDKILYKNMSKEAIKKSKKFELENCLQEMKKIYSQFLDV